MAADEIQGRAAFGELLKELTDSDIVIEMAAGVGGRQLLDTSPVKRLQEAVEASYKALAGSVKIQLETSAVLEEVSKHSFSLWLRVRRAGDALCG